MSDIDELKEAFDDIAWMARRYVHGRRSYAPSMFEDAITVRKKFGDFEMKDDPTLQPNPIYVQALDKWGSVAQLDMMVEESAELIQAIQKLRRKESRETWDHFAEEVADVLIMAEQMQLIIDKVNEKQGWDIDIESWRQQKLKRLRGKL